MNRKSIRKYEPNPPSDELIKTIVKAGMQAPYAAQLYSIILSRNREEHPFKAPLLFTICFDAHKLELIMTRMNWKMITNDLSFMMLAIQDAALMAENMVIAAESFGMGSCFLGHTPNIAAKLAKQYNLPKRVFPLVQLTIGYPAEDHPTRPRYPMEFVLFEDEYPEFTEEEIQNAMKVMNEGFLVQDYYKQDRFMLPLEVDRKETFTYENYSWCEHQSRKWGQWNKSPKNLLEQFEKCGFNPFRNDNGD